MMEYIYVTAVISIILVIATLTGCTCAMIIAFTRKWINKICGVPEKKHNKVIEVPKTKEPKTKKPEAKEA